MAVKEGNRILQCLFFVVCFCRVALFLACHAQWEDAVKTLLDAGADVNKGKYKVRSRSGQGRNTFKPTSHNVTRPWARVPPMLVRAQVCGSKKTLLPCWLSRGQHVSHQRCI